MTDEVVMERPELSHMDDDYSRIDKCDLLAIAKPSSQSPTSAVPSCTSTLAESLIDDDGDGGENDYNDPFAIVSGETESGDDDIRSEGDFVFVDNDDVTEKDFSSNTTKNADGSDAGTSNEQKSLADLVAEANALDRKSWYRSPVYPQDSRLEGPESENPAPSLRSIQQKVKKAGVAIGGGVMVGAGLVFIPTLPPPFGEVLIAGGVSLLGTEFEAPKRIVRNGRDKLAELVVEEDKDKNKLDGECADNHDNGAGESCEKNGSDDNRQQDMIEANSSHKIGMKERLKGFTRRVVIPFMDQISGGEQDMDKKEDKNE